MLEHRLFTRFVVPGEVLIQLQGATIETVRAELVDISFKGAGAYSAKMIAVDTRVRFFISSKSFEKHIRGEGRIRYAHAHRRKDVDVYRLGIEFVDVDSELVRDILTRLSEKNYK
jgi:c-di-GMP-binding flagellar brake protein YcgR